MQSTVNLKIYKQSKYLKLDLCIRFIDKIIYNTDSLIFHALKLVFFFQIAIWKKCAIKYNNSLSVPMTCKNNRKRNLIEQN